jgi:hypothetical protein
MAKTTTVQYQPITAMETAAADGLSVRFVRDMGLALNNYRFHAGNHQIICQMFLPHVESLDDTTNDLILYLGKWYIPPGFSQVRWWLNGRVKTGTGITTWTLGVAPDFYQGPEAFDSSLLGDYASSTIDVSSSGWDILDNAMTLSRADFNGFRWFYLLAENDTGDTDPTTRAQIVSINVQPLET